MASLDSSMFLENGLSLSWVVLGLYSWGVLGSLRALWAGLGCSGIAFLGSLGVFRCSLGLSLGLSGLTRVIRVEHL